MLVETVAGQVAFEGKGTIVVPPHGRLVVDLPGGGGFGAAAVRDRQLVARDLANGLVSAAAARQVYGLKDPAENGK